MLVRFKLANGVSSYEYRGCVFTLVPTPDVWIAVFDNKKISTAQHPDKETTEKMAHDNIDSYYLLLRKEPTQDIIDGLIEELE
jgi:hypothetical protein